MRPLKSVIAIMLLLACATSCKKEEPKKTATLTQTVNMDKMKADLKQINAKYTRLSALEKTTEKKGSTATAVGADLVAACMTAKAVWSWCATGWGGLAAGGVTVVATAVASYTTYRSLNDVVMIPNDPAGQKGRIIANVGTYAISNPYGNPYYSTGVSHNAYMKVLCQKSQDLPLAPVTLMFARADFNETQLSYLENDEAGIGYNVCTFFNDPNNYINNGTFDYAPMLNHFFADDSTLNGIMPIFMQGLFQITDETAAMSFISDYENYFINNQTGISEQDKYALLNGFAVGKYSYAMWDNALYGN